MLETKLGSANWAATAEPRMFATAQQLAYSYVRDRILSGKYAGGMRLDPAEIGQALGISRMPVREALRQLDSEGLIVMRPNRGALVTRLTPLEVEELFEIRAVLEALAARFAVAQVTDDALSELQMLKSKMDRARSDPRLWIQRHADLHQFISVLGQRTLLARELGRIRTAAQPYLLMYISVYNSTEMEGYEHDALLAAISSRDGDAAEICMRDHVRRAARGIIEFLKTRETEGTERPVE